MSIDRHALRGFGHVVLIVFLVVAAGIGGIAYIIHNRQQSQTTGDSQTATHTKTLTDVPGVPDVKDEADLDAAAKTLDQVDPTNESQGDLTDIDNQTKGL